MKEDEEEVQEEEEEKEENEEKSLGKKCHSQVGHLFPIALWDKTRSF